MKIQITVDGVIYPIHRDVATTHPKAVHDALGTSSEPELQQHLSQCHISDWYRDGKHLGPDIDGLEMLAEQNDATA